ncbi:tyrosine-type recombinase/integrase [Modestobacter sp. URMC 112]
MASVEARLTRRNGREAKVYDVRFRDPDGRQRKRTFAKKGDAGRFAATVEADKLRGLYVDHRAGRVTLADFAEQRWLPSLVHVRPNTLTLYQAHLRNHVLPAFGSRSLGSLRRQDCRSFVAALAARLAPATVSTVYAVLRMVMQTAVDDGLIAANPCSRVPLPRIEHRVIEPLPAASVVALADAMPNRYAVTVWLAAGAGLREGEALGLTATRVDFLRRRVHVEEQLQGANGAAPSLAPLKTRASRRVVPVDDFVLTELTTHMQQWRLGPSGLLVTNRLGAPVRRSSFGHCWQVAVEGCGLPRGTRFHDLRHFYASALIGAGLHPKAIQARLGHATIAETMDTYGHLFPDSEDHGRGALDNLLREARVPSGCHAAAAE